MTEWEYDDDSLIYFGPPSHEQTIRLGEFYKGLQHSSQTVSLLREIGDAVS